MNCKILLCTPMPACTSYGFPLKIESELLMFAHFSLLVIRCQPNYFMRMCWVLMFLEIWIILLRFETWFSYLWYPIKVQWMKFTDAHHKQRYHLDSVLCELISIKFNKKVLHSRAQQNPKNWTLWFSHQAASVVVD